MNVELTQDDQAILLLCSRLGRPAGREASSLDVYTLADWNALARRLNAAGMRPGDLLELDAAPLAGRAGVPLAEAERVARLLESGGQLAIELERLASLGIRATTRASARYPSRLRSKLRDAAPQVLYYSGELALAETRCLAVVGSRDVDEAGAEFAERLAEWAARDGIAVVSGAARGVDSIAMRGALVSGGTVVGFPADSLERMIRSADTRSAIADERLLLLTPFNPRAPFSVGNAMARNKLIYAQSNWAVVVAAETEKGGTWAGAVECLRSGWTPVFARSGDTAPAGNVELLRRGARPLAAVLMADPGSEMGTEERRPLAVLLEAPAPGEQSERQPDLFAAVDGGERADAATSTNGAPTIDVESRAPADPAQAGDVSWSADWESFLEEARSEADLVRHFGLPRAEVKARLQVLVDSGRVRRTTRPTVRYQAVPMKL